MKTFSKIGLIILFLLCTMLLSVKADAAELSSATSGESYFVTEKYGFYEVYKSSDTDTEPTYKTDKLGEGITFITSQSDSAVILFGAVTSDEPLVFDSGTYTLKGKLAFSGSNGILIDNASVSFIGADVSFVDGALRLKRGAVLLEESNISSQKTAIKMDYSSQSELRMESGSVTSSSTSEAFLLNYGTARISGGSIKNTVGVAIATSATLILSDSPQICGVDADVYATSPITLSDGGKSFLETVRVKFAREFEKGRASIVAYDASCENENNLILLDTLGREISVKYYDTLSGVSERNFLTAYIPFEVSFGAGFDGESQYYLYGERVSLPSADNRAGYEFLGWKIGGYEGELYEENLPISEDLILFASYRLKAPQFSFLSMSFTYDAEEHFLSLCDLSHPLLAEGVMTYKWYKDGEELSLYGDKIPIKNVLDSGKYKCLFTFSHKSDVVSVETPEISVDVYKQKIDLPTVESVEYNGEVRHPEIYSVSLYNVEYDAPRDAGIYPIILTLKDAENYGFGEELKGCETAYFEITKAVNFWIESPTCKDVYSWQAPMPYATSKFGTVKFLYSEAIDGIYSETSPVGVGKHYVKALVEGTENYTALSSDSIEFQVLIDSVESIHIVTDANKRSYTAFESFSADGLSVVAAYVSGKEVPLNFDELSISYSRGTSFLYGDSFVKISYSDKSIAYPVTVTKAEYDLSGISFSDCSYEYSGKSILPEFYGYLPVGTDGIQLTASVIGGGTAAGIYGIELRFHTESENYLIPEKMTATLTVTKREVDVVWTSLNFVYDGNVKVPSAYYTDVFGREIFLSVGGGRSYAGSYEAEVTIGDSNYMAKNPRVQFFIAKADYDLSSFFWSGEKLIYNGEEQRITLSGLPNGVSVVGYSDNRATNVGKYLAGVTLSYDESNYNSPEVSSYEWEILAAEYDESGFYFEDGIYVYDGDEHFPVFFGAMPKGFDGISPSFTYSKGAVNVIEGRVSVLIEFSTESKNYVAPKSREYFVEITPKGINVLWSGVSFIYSDSLFAPSAVADECEIAVIGAKSIAGKHIATAKTLDANYFVVNAEREFEILKAENYWITPPTICSVYESGALAPCGAAAFGETSYVYSTDKINLINTPVSAGIYYFKAMSDGDENHNFISSDWITVEIIAVSAEGISVEMLKTSFLTLEKLSDSDVNIYVSYNDSSTEKLLLSEINVEYQSGEAFSFSDTSVTFSYLGFLVSAGITVYKRDYDLSAIFWEGTRGVFDGKEKNATLRGLPEGVMVVSYFGNGVINAGTYLISATVSYDEKNYNPPAIPNAVMTIERQVVIIPEIKSKEYSASLLLPDIEASELYSYEFSGAKDSGNYTLNFKLTDSKNYCFEGNLDTVDKSFEITKRKLVVKISDVERYLGGKYSDPSFEIISGEIIKGENIIPIYEIEKDGVFAKFYSQNYDIEVIKGEVYGNERLSPEDTRIILFIFITVALAFIVIIIILCYRKRIVAYYHGVFIKSENFIPSAPLEDNSHEGNETVECYEENTGFRETECEFVDTEEPSDIEEELSIEPESTMIDAVYADSVITDSLAKSLIRKDVVVETEGRRREIINVDTLSRSFSSGERVDINLLKGKSLVPYDVAYIKVLARGIIDKPLDVYANDFSLSAVKMIALAGGKSVKVTTSTKNKSSDKGDFNKKT